MVFYGSSTLKRYMYCTWLMQFRLKCKAFISSIHYIDIDNRFSTIPTLIIHYIYIFVVIVDVFFKYISLVIFELLLIYLLLRRFYTVIFLNITWTFLSVNCCKKMSPSLFISTVF